MDFIFNFISFIFSWIPSISFESFTYSISVIKDYIIIPLWTCISYPFKWLLGFTSNFTTPDIPLKLDNLLNTDNQIKRNEESQFPDKVVKRDKINNNKNIIIQHGINSTLKKLRSIWAQSLTPEEIADAHTQGRDEVKEQHRIKGALSLSAHDIAKAFEIGKKEALQQHRNLGFHSVSTEEQTEVFQQGRADKLQGILRNASRISEELTKTTYQNALDASYISLLHRIEIDSNDYSIIEKALFCTKLSECLKDQTLQICKEEHFKLLQPIFDEEICP
ncbi:MAG: hypothetical protein KBC27_02710 [Rickettsiales bacterium]|nr:hypothetical protein [Rickettsiales bacterium]